MLSDSENVARVIFSPRMIYQGVLQPEAFRLRGNIAEEYLSVLRTVIPTWRDDVLSIPQRKNRQLYGYAEMSVKDIRNASFQDVSFDVAACNNLVMKSHAGIFITVGGEQLIGGKQLETIASETAQNHLLLLIQRRLVEIARKRLIVTV